MVVVPQTMELVDLVVDMLLLQAPMLVVVLVDSPPVTPGRQPLGDGGSNSGWRRWRWKQSKHR